MGDFSRWSIPCVSVSPVFCSIAVPGAPVPLLPIHDVFVVPVPRDTSPQLCHLCVPSPHLHSRAFSLFLSFPRSPNGTAGSRGLVIRFALGFWVCSHATPRAWNDLQTFTAPFHCFLSGPSSKHSFPMTYANLLTVLYEP